MSLNVIPILSVPLSTQAGRLVGRPADAEGRERQPDSLIQVAIPEVKTAKSSGPD